MDVTEWFAAQQIDNVLDTILSSPSLFLMTLGSLMVLVALAIRTGVWPALMTIFGASLFLAGAIAQTVRMWTRRKST